MKPSKNITKISKKIQKLLPATALKDLSDAESQTIQGGIALLLPAIQTAREAARK